jgi:ankyrin repeat protein
MDPEWRDAVLEGRIAVVRDGLATGAAIDARDRYGQTGLMLAARAGRREIVALLSESGADLDATAKFGLSALMLAIVAGHEDIARDLVRAGADASLRGTGAPGFAGKTARDLAEVRGMGALLLELDRKAAARASGPRRS